jgi:phosphohistidine phosphatase
MHEPSSDAPRRLVVMRHAKAVATAPSDHERALAERGHADAASVGRWMRDHDIVPDAALVSDAARTRETWEGVALAAGWDLAADFSAALYDAGPDSAFDLLREVDAGVRTLVVVGHNPTMAYLAELIDDGDGDVEATTSLLMRGLPTSGLALFGLTAEWRDLGPGAGRLLAFRAGEA